MAKMETDRRVQKTRQLLQRALAELIAEKEYYAISIQEILDRANVGRSTFYLHFENKDQLLRSLLNQLQDRFDEGINQISVGGKTMDENSTQMPFNILYFVQQNHRLFKAMLLPHGRDIDNNPFREHLLALTREHFKLMILHEDKDSRLLEMATHYYAGAFLGVLTWWLENEMCYSAQELGDMLNQLILPGFRMLFVGSKQI